MDPKTVVYTFSNKYNDTLANTLNVKLLENSKVIFCGSEMVKPHVDYPAITIMAENPDECLDTAINGCLDDLEEFEQAFRKKL